MRHFGYCDICSTTLEADGTCPTCDRPTDLRPQPTATYARIDDGHYVTYELRTICLDAVAYYEQPECEHCAGHAADMLPPTPAPGTIRLTITVSADASDDLIETLFPHIPHDAAITIDDKDVRQCYHCGMPATEYTSLCPVHLSHALGDQCMQHGHQLASTGECMQCESLYIHQDYEPDEAPERVPSCIPEPCYQCRQPVPLDRHSYCSDTCFDAAFADCPF